MSGALKAGFAGAVVVGIGRLASAGRLPRNAFAGIRLPSTMRSDAAWRAGHQAAGSALTAAGIGEIAVAAFVGTRKPGDRAQTALLCIGTGWLLGWVALATMQASRAAREVS